MSEPCACDDLGYVCQRCLERFARQLGDVPALLGELEVARYEPRRGGSLAGGRAIGHARPLPFNPAAGELAREIRVGVRGCAQEVMRDLHMPEQWSSLSLAEAVGFLLSNLEWFERDGGDRTRHAMAWLGERSASARRMILGPGPDRWFAGVCGAPLTEVMVSVDVDEHEVGDSDQELVLVPHVQVGQRPTGSCDARLFAEIGRATVKCRREGCGATYQVEDRRAELVAAAERTLLPLGVILEALPLLIGAKVNKATARSWRRDRKAVPARPAVEATEAEPARPARPARPFVPRMLHAHSVDIDGQELYWVGEVLALARMAVARSDARVEARSGRSSAAGM